MATVYSVTVVLPRIQADFGVARADDCSDDVGMTFKRRHAATFCEVPDRDVMRHAGGGKPLGKQMRSILQPPILASELPHVAAEWTELVGFRLRCLNGERSRIRYRVRRDGRHADRNRVRSRHQHRSASTFVSEDTTLPCSSLTTSTRVSH